jgi:hypothetical protein
MSALQKQAWYNLVVVVGSLVVVLGLIPVLGRGAMAGFGFLGLLGLTPFLFRKGEGKVLCDERDQLINQRSAIGAYSVFWLLYVAACMGLPAVYGWNGSVPVPVVMSSVFAAWILFSLIHSLATLVQYGRGGSDAS